MVLSRIRRDSIQNNKWSKLISRVAPFNILKGFIFFLRISLFLGIILVFASTLKRLISVDIVILRLRMREYGCMLAFLEYLLVVRNIIR